MDRESKYHAQYLLSNGSKIDYVVNRPSDMLSKLSSRVINGNIVARYWIMMMQWSLLNMCNMDDSSRLA